MRLIKTLILKPILFTLAPIVVFPVLFIILGYLSRPGSRPVANANYLTNPQTAKDFAQRCEALFMNRNDQASLVLGEQAKNAPFDKKVKNPIFQQAILDCDRAIQLDPQLADSYLWRGNARSILGDTQAAITDYWKAQALLREQGKERDAKGIERMIKNADNFAQQRKNQ